MTDKLSEYTSIDDFFDDNKMPHPYIIEDIKDENPITEVLFSAGNVALFRSFEVGNRLTSTQSRLTYGLLIFNGSECIEITHWKYFLESPKDHDSCYDPGTMVTVYQKGRGMIDYCKYLDIPINRITKEFMTESRFDLEDPIDRETIIMQDAEFAAPKLISSGRGKPELQIQEELKGVADAIGGWSLKMYQFAPYVRTFKIIMDGLGLPYR